MPHTIHHPSLFAPPPPLQGSVIKAARKAGRCKRLDHTIIHNRSHKAREKEEEALWSGRACLLVLLPLGWETSQSSLSPPRVGTHRHVQKPAPLLHAGGFVSQNIQGWLSGAPAVHPCRRRRRRTIPCIIPTQPVRSPPLSPSQGQATPTRAAAKAPTWLHSDWPDSQLCFSSKLHPLQAVRGGAYTSGLRAQAPQAQRRWGSHSWIASARGNSDLACGRLAGSP